MSSRDVAARAQEATERWNAIAPVLRELLPRGTYEAFFARVWPEDVIDGKLVLEVPDTVTAEWVEAHFAELLNMLGVRCQPAPKPNGTTGTVTVSSGPATGVTFRGRVQGSLRGMVRSERPVLATRRARQRAPRARRTRATVARRARSPGSSSDDGPEPHVVDVAALGGRR